MATRRQIFLDPSSDGSKVAWIAYGGASTDWQAVSKATRSPSAPTLATGVQSSTTTDIERINYPSLTGLLNPGESISYLRLWTYFDGAVPTNQSVAITLYANTTGGNALVMGGASVAAGTSGWVSTPRLSPWLNRGSAIGLPGPVSPTADTFTGEMTLTETATQAANTNVAAQYVEVGVSTMGHIIPERQDAQDMFATNTITGGAWTYDAGSGTLSVASNLLVPSDTAEKRLIWANKTMVDGRMQWFVDPTATTTNTLIGPIVKRLDANNYIRCTIGGTSPGLRIVKVDGGVATTLASSTAYTAADTDARVRVRMDGNWITFEVFSGIAGAGVTEASPVATQTLRWELAGADATKFGLGVRGGVGLYWVPHATGERAGEATVYKTGTRMVGMYDPDRVYRFSFSQYASVAYDDWMTDAGNVADPGGRTYVHAMNAHKLDFLRIFIGFGQQMGDYAAIVKSDSPSDYWRFNEASGTVAGNQMGNIFFPRQSGTHVNTPTLAATGAMTGDPDKAVSYVAASSEETTISSTLLDTNCAIEFWFKWTTGTALLRDHSTTGGWIIGFDNAGTLAVRLAGTVTINTSITTAAARDGNWHHLVVNKTGANATVYYDNAQVGTGSGIANTSSSSPWHIGRNGAVVAYSDMTIDELAFYPTALSATRIADHFKARSTAPETGVNENNWQHFENFLDMCVDENVRLDVTGITTFSGPGSGQVPPWMDLADGTPVFNEAQRWAAFGVWWKRCAQAVAGCPAVVMLDLTNEPLALDGESADWYIGSTPYYYGTFLSLVRSGRTESQVMLDFMKQMRAAIRPSEPIKPITMADHGTAPGAAPTTGSVPSGVIASMSDMTTPHVYIKNGASAEDWLQLVLPIWKSIGKPFFCEEGGSTSPTIWWFEHYVDFATKLLDRGSLAVQGGWPSALDPTASDLSMQYHQRIERYAHRRDRSGGRVASRDRHNGRVGPRCH